MNDKLKNAIIDQVGGEEEEALQDIKEAGKHGADGGTNGFIYDDDMVSFYDANREEIETYMKEKAEDFGFKNILEMVFQFGRSDLLNNDHIKGLKILSCWFCLEGLGQELEYEDEEEEND